MSIRATIGNNDWTNIGKYVATNPNITQEIFALIKGLDRDSKNLVLRQIALSLKAYKSNESVITDITKQEIADILKERDEFFPNLFKLNDNLCTYDSYWLPTNAVTAEAFFINIILVFCNRRLWQKYGIKILSMQVDILAIV